MTRIGLLALLYGSILVTPAWAGEAGSNRWFGLAQGEPWIHVEVVEEGEEGENVNIDLPLSTAQAVLGAVPADVLLAGHSALLLPLSLLDGIWEELRKVGDREVVTVESEDETVRISRQGDLLLIHVDDLTDNDEVRVAIPVPVVDVLLSYGPGELHLGSALGKLKDHRGEVVRVDDGDSQVRIWIDERN